MTEEIFPELYRIKIPLPESPLKYLNSYVVKSHDRTLIVDTGFNRNECFDAMNNGLRKINVDLADCDFFITHLNAESAHIEVTFPYFIEKKAPVSNAPGLMDYTCRIIGSNDPSGKTDIISEVIVPISSVCPCSKEISEKGAHNQRGEVRLSTRFKKFIWMEDMIELVENSASCDVYSVLKRVDEKCVTEKAFSNPKFVEDIVRDIAEKLKKDDNITWFSVSAENFESIHNHNAYAHITSS